MNRYIAVAIMALLSFVGFNAFAADSCHRDWKDEMRAEKIAYLTTAMGLTPSEAEKFWPLYNKMESERDNAFRKVMETYRALDEGLKAGKSEKEIAVLLNDYVEAMDESRSTEARYTEIFTKVISVEKVARLFIGEEEFRRRQISRWHGDKK